MYNVRRNVPCPVANSEQIMGLEHSLCAAKDGLNREVMLISQRLCDVVFAYYRICQICLMQVTG